MSQPKVALVTDWITKTGGGEKVVEQFHRIYPDAPIYASYCSELWRARLDQKVITGYLQHWPFSKLRRFLPLLRQWWFRSLNLSAFDIVISITGNGEAKFVRTSEAQTHICYCHTPVHFYWAQYNGYLAHPSMKPYWLARLGLKLLVRPLRKRDFAAAQHVDHFIANSGSIQADIKRFYKQDSVIIHPPINVEQFAQLSPHTKERMVPKVPECIWWGRIVPAKRLDIAIEACNQLKWPLRVIGDGPELARLKAMAGETITFTGYVDDEMRNELIRTSDLFLFPSKEDFGVAPVEALAAGLPVLAYKAGGALDYIHDKVNGAFFEQQTADSMKSGMERSVGLTFQTKDISKSSHEFSAGRFRDKVASFVSSKVAPTRP